MNKNLKKLTLSALFLAIGIVLPLFTMQIKEIGDTLLPMHIPVLLCGILCGGHYGFAVGLMLPFIRSFIFSMPPLYPNAVWMAAELATYGLVVGILYNKLKIKGIAKTYVSLLIAMLSGRIVWGIAKTLLLFGTAKTFTLAAFISGGFVDALPGIILQLLLIPLLVKIIDGDGEKMKTVAFHYGKGKVEHTFNSKELIAVLESSINGYKPALDESGLVEQAMKNPVGSKTLCELARGKKNVVIIASDHTRPVPSKVIIPPMLREIREGNPEADITILIATGCHRGTTKEELIAKFGEEIVENEKIYVHDCLEEEKLVNIGTLPSGSDCVINKIAAEADLLVAEGFIEPHFFAGFSGGRKSVLPGISGRATVLGNHCSEFIANKNARTGILENNPIHTDMLWAAKQAKLAFIVNVVLNAEKEVIFATAGDCEAAHKKGTDFIKGLCEVKAKPADIVISTNGGYPLDQNVYQAVKGMTAAEATARDGGVIIMLARSNDGIGGDHFYHQLADEADINKTMEIFMSRGRGETVPDQWQTQVLLRVLKKASVIYISEMEAETVEKMHMLPAKSIGEALEKAKELLGKKEPSIVAIPDGISVIVKE